MSAPPIALPLWLAALGPVVALLVLVLSGRIRAHWAAAIVVTLAAVLGLGPFQAGPEVLAVGLGKGLWLGGWILLVVWPALLLERLTSVAGVQRLGRLFMSVLSRRRENLLVVAWVFPAFIQGVAGFGTPIALTAPLLVAMGWGPVRAIAYPVIGYHWAVTFGSMGSSFYMASLTTGLTGQAQLELALRAGVLLAVNCLLAGALVLLMDGGLDGLREGGRVLVLVGVPMALTLVGTALIVPAVASLAAGSAGFLSVAALALLRRRPRPAVAVPRRGGVPSKDGRPREQDAPPSRPPPDLPPSAHPPVQDATPRSPERRPGVLLAPYAFLLATALPVFLVPASRDWVRSNLLLAPDFPATTTGLGWHNPAVLDYTPIGLFGHPGFYVLLAGGLGYLTYRAWGLWPAGGGRRVVAEWLRSLPSASAAILLLACLATVLQETAMIAVLARGIADVTGSVFPALSPAVGALGSFMTGSTTSSNALFAPLQADIASAIGTSPTALVAAQTAGGNVGNALSPVILLIGAAAVHAPQRISEILRLAAKPVAVLLGVVALITVVSTW